MRSLLDVNYLVALLDPEHVFHDDAHASWSDIASNGWASCPITEIGAVRVLSSSRYPGLGELPISMIIERVRDLIARTDHESWADPLSILDESVFDRSLIVGPKQLTDIYLLGLASRKGGRLVTFDRKIPVGAVRSATDANLMVI